MSKITRRHFLQTGGAVVALASLGAVGSLWKKKVPGFPTYLSGVATAQYPRGAFAILSEHAEIMNAWDVGFLAHSIWQNPVHPWQIVGVEKLGSRAALLDTRGDGSVRKISAPKNMKFYGHGLFSPDGESLYFTATPKAEPTGYLISYDLKNLKPVSQTLTQGHYPHDLQRDLLSPDRFVLANAGSIDLPSTLTWVSAHNGKIEKQIPMSHEALRAAHFQQRPDGSIYVLGYNIQLVKDRTIHKPCSFGTYARNQETVHMLSDQWSDELHGEVLNVFADEKSSRLWLSLPFASKLVVLDQKTFEKLEVFDLPEPRALVPMESNGSRLLVVTTGDKAAPKNHFFDLGTVAAVSREENDFYAFHIATL